MNRNLFAIFMAVVMLCLPVSLFSTKRALLIGIGTYMEGSGWNSINGDNDLPLLESMLIANGFSMDNIIELKNSDATAAGIRSAMTKLLNQASSNDIIYIQFSGHGQQVTDLNGDEADGLDEAWIPYDARFAFVKGKYEGENHILDDELNSWLTKLRAKVGTKGKITVVADACHSGDGSRSTDDEDSTMIVRGTRDIFQIPGKHTAYSGEKSSSVVSWTYIAACKPYQCNYEYKGNGSLTYALTHQETSLSKLSCSQLRSSLRSIISLIVPYTQTPVVDLPTDGGNQSIF